MIDTRFSYPHEKSMAALRALTIPVPDERAAYAAAMQEIELGFRDEDELDLDENAARYLARLREIMDTEGIEDPGGEGTLRVRAKQLTEEEQHDFSRNLHELTWNTARRYYTGEL